MPAKPVPSAAGGVVVAGDAAGCVAGSTVAAGEDAAGC